MCVSTGYHRRASRIFSIAILSRTLEAPPRKMQTTQQSLGDCVVVTFESPRMSFVSSSNLRFKGHKRPSFHVDLHQAQRGRSLLEHGPSRFRYLWRVFESSECVRRPQTYGGKPRDDPVRFGVVRRVDQSEVTRANEMENVSPRARPWAILHQCQLGK